MITADSITSQATAERYRELVDSAVAAHMNMIRYVCPCHVTCVLYCSVSFQENASQCISYYVDLLMLWG